MTIRRAGRMHHLGIGTVERRLVGVNRRPEGGKAGPVDQDIDLACCVGDAPHLGHLREISGDELRIVSTRPDLLYGARAAGSHRGR